MSGSDQISLDVPQPGLWFYELGKGCEVVESVCVAAIQGCVELACAPIQDEWPIILDQLVGLASVGKGLDLWLGALEFVGVESQSVFFSIEVYDSNCACCLCVVAIG